MVRPLDRVEDVAGFDADVLQEVRSIPIARDSAQPLDHVKELRATTHFQVEAGIAVGQDVESGPLLLLEVARDRVDVLLAVQRVAHRDLEGPPAQALGEPRRPGKRPDHRCNQLLVRVAFSMAVATSEN